MTRALSGRQAAACEYADGGRCRCTERIQTIVEGVSQ